MAVKNKQKGSSTLIEVGTLIKGEIIFDNELFVMGEVDGDLNSESDLAKGLISHGQFNLLEIENALTAPIILWTYDLDSCEFESGMSEDYVVSEQVSNDVRAILMI